MANNETSGKLPTESQPQPQPQKKKRRSVAIWLRDTFLAGLVVTVPIFITFYLVSWGVQLLDNWFKPFIPIKYHPETYLPFSVPGIGVILTFVLLTLVGALAANFFGKFLLTMSDRAIQRMPVVGTLYSAIRQIMRSTLRDGASFSKVALIEYPRKDVYAIAFVTKAAEKRVNEAAGETMIGVFLPTTPNPTSGFLLFLPERDIIILDMTVEEGARLVISAGLADDEEGQPAH